jgi:DNA-binding NarL/FixJ family response regulator
MPCESRFHGRPIPDLLILDICMPKLNGVDVAPQILKSDPAQRIVVPTGVNSEDVVRACLALGVRGWKSGETDELTKAVGALERHDSAFSSSVSTQILDGYPIRDWLGGHRS